MEQLAALARACVEPCFSRFGVTNETHSLGADVLHFEFPGMKVRGPKQIHQATIAQDVGKMAPAESAAPLENSSQGTPLPWPGTQPKFRLGLNGPHPIRGDHHFILDPSGHCSIHQFVNGKTFRAGTEPTGQLESTIDLGADLLILIEPTSPTIKCEDGSGHFRCVLGPHGNLSL